MPGQLAIQILQKYLTTWATDSDHLRDGFFSFGKIFEQEPGKNEIK